MKHLTSPGKNRIIFLLIPVIALIAYIGYGQYDSWQTKQKFASIEQDIDSLKAELEKQGISGISKNKYCLRDGEKFGGGQLRCETRLSWLIKDSAPIIEPEKILKNIAVVTSSKNDNDEVIQYKHAQGLNCYQISHEAQNYEFYCIDAVNKAVYPIIE